MTKQNQLPLTNFLIGIDERGVTMITSPVIPSSWLQVLSAPETLEAELPELPELRQLADGKTANLLRW